MKQILFASPLHYTSDVKLGGHQFAKQFSCHGWNVYYISNPLTPFNILFGRNKKEIAQRLKIYMQGGIYADNVWAYVPLTLIPHHNNAPVLNRKIFLDNYHRFIVPSIPSIIRNKKLDTIDILWLDWSNQVFWTKILKYRTLIYRIADNYLAFKQISDATLRSHYEIMEKADVILMPSRHLIDGKENDPYREKILYCPNGVDLLNFQSNHHPMPEEYTAARGRHIALYIGSIDDWFDFELLNYLGYSNPNILFVIVGPLNVPIPHGMAKNILFLGKRAYRDIPQFITYCDFGIIPFKNNDLVQYVSPIKMYEFLFMGKPVVSTSWQELRSLNAPIYLADNKEGFVSHIKTILDGQEPFTPEDLIDFAGNNTWERRYDMVLNSLGMA